jgi:hypothetical protein
VIAYSTALNRVADTEIDFIFPVTAPAPARIALSVPAGYTIAPAMLGAKVASVDADVVVGGATKHVDDFRKLGTAKTNKQGVYTLRKKLSKSM